MPQFFRNFVSVRSAILYYISSLILRLCGWNIHGSMPEGVKKCVIAIAPHTSWWDSIIGRLSFWYLRIKVNILIKEEAFKPPFGWLIRISGGIPVDRAHGSGTGNMILHKIKNSESICIVITPEGTRAATKRWKKGFYFLAQKADIPILMGFIDYKKKEGGIGPMIMPSGDLVKDFEVMQKFYDSVTPRHPDRYLPPDWS
jgi:1-acyl-sn-glycerol-3-phosphate acyltransferase